MNEESGKDENASLGQDCMDYMRFDGEWDMSQTYEEYWGKQVYCELIKKHRTAMRDEVPAHKKTSTNHPQPTRLL